MRDALLLAQENDWVRASEVDGGIREGAEVTELSELYEVAGWHDDMRVICRRERPHPGASSPTSTARRVAPHPLHHQTRKARVFAALELRHRGHARVEDQVRTWKACGLANLPFEGAPTRPESRSA